jgi:hypothetical protein
MQRATLQISNLARFAESALQAFEICDRGAIASQLLALLSYVHAILKGFR